MRFRLPALILVLALFAAACGDDGGSDTAPAADGGGDGTADDSSADGMADDGTADDGSDDGAAAPDVDFEVFSVDEGAGCAVYVSVPENAATGDLKVLIWQGVVAQEFTDCGFSDVVEVGLLTVNGLDEYNQPDFAQTVEHGYFAVEGWDGLLADCYAAVLDDACVAQVEAAFTE